MAQFLNAIIDKSYTRRRESRDSRVNLKQIDNYNSYRYFEMLELRDWIPLTWCDEDSFPLWPYEIHTVVPLGTIYVGWKKIQLLLR